MLFAREYIYCFIFGVAAPILSRESVYIPIYFFSFFGAVVNANERVLFLICISVAVKIAVLYIRFLASCAALDALNKILRVFTSRV